MEKNASENKNIKKKSSHSDSSIHKLQTARRRMRQRNIYDKLKQIKENEEKAVKVNVKNTDSKIKKEIENKEKVKTTHKKENIKKSNKQQNNKNNRKKQIENKKITENKNKIKKTTKNKEQKRNKKSKLKTPKEWKKSRRIKSIIIAILLILIIAMSYFVYMVYLNGGGLKGLIAASLGHNPTKVENLEQINVLIVGENEKNTDTIILASYNPKTQEASMLSIPRDSFVGANINTAPASQKINAIYANQGIDPLVKKVEGLTGLEIPYYVILKVDNISNLVNLTGGVEFDVPIDMFYYDPTQKLNIKLNQGKQIIDGDKAEMLLRFRHNDDGSTYPPEYGVEDIGRMKTQRNFIKAMLQKMISDFDIGKIYELINRADEFVETNLKFKDYRDYVPYILEFNPDNIKVAKAEGRGVLTTYYFYLLDYDQLDKIIFDLFVFSDDERKNNPESFKVKRNINQNTVVESKKVVAPQDEVTASKNSEIREQKEEKQNTITIPEEDIKSDIETVVPETPPKVEESKPTPKPPETPPAPKPETPKEPKLDN